MRALHLLIWILLEQTMASREVLYVQGIQEESVDISCEPQQGKAPPTGFHLYRKSAQPGEKDLLLSISEHQDIKPEFKGRVKISKQPSLSVINVTLLDLRSKDTGLYVCEFTTAADPEKMLVHTEIVLLVKVKEAGCSCVGHSSLIYAISVAVGLLLFTLLSLSAARYRKLKAHTEPRTAAPIYEEMTANKPLNPRLAQTYLPANDPVYAAPQKAERPECHYAVPRKAANMQEISPALAVEIDQCNLIPF
ncbi:uncharacterized protein LOC118801263 [Colossoma macropomum]|uniref:uncharacterized protein LOC118801263 n=1 Tax=Colossoma macropomum TaxID=42526 RepID=UPI001864AEDC|nr:uncharacterized protein LOC118801263 [Colossoma macropomum]